MFAKQFRLPATAYLAHPSFSHCQFFAVKIAENSLPHNRYGFVVSKKIDKRATVRNRLKRRIRACVEHMHPKLVAGNDFLFMIKPNAKEESTDILCKEIEKICMQQKLFL